MKVKRTNTAAISSSHHKPVTDFMAATVLHRATLAELVLVHYINEQPGRL